MTIIYRKNDLISLKIGDLTFNVKPMTYIERVEVMTCLSNVEGTVVENAAKATFLAMKYTIRKLDGAFLVGGEKYKVEIAEDGYISDESIDDLLNIEQSGNLGKALHNFLKGVPAKLIDPRTGKELEGVEIVNQGGVPKK